MQHGARLGRRDTERASVANLVETVIAVDDKRVPAGYSQNPLSTKLGVKSGHVVALLRAPDGWSIPAPPRVETRRDLRKQPDIVLAFVRSLADLRRQRQRLVAALRAEDSLWLVRPRKAGGHVSDVSEQALRDEFLSTGLVDNKVASLDDDWSALRFVWRRENRTSRGSSTKR